MDEAEKLLARMRASKAGWGAKDLEKLYCGFGFEYREGANHRLYFHPKYPQLTATVARHNSLAIGYVVSALRIIARLKDIEARERGEHG